MSAMPERLLIPHRRVNFANSRPTGGGSGSYGSQVGVEQLRCFEAI